MLRILLSLCILMFICGLAGAEPPQGSVVGKLDCLPGDCSGVAALWRADNNKPPAPDRYLLVPAVVSELKEDGSFELLAPVGDYFIGGQIRKTSGPVFGAPRNGDLIYLISPEDEAGYRVRVDAEQVKDIGLQKDFWVFTEKIKTPSMGISGRVLNLEKQPVAGLLVFAFADPGSSSTPLAISDRTTSAGRFLLPMVSSGPVYLRARKNFRGGQPQSEDYIGVAVDGNSKPILVKPGQLTEGVEVFVRKLPSVLTGKNAPDTARPQFD